MADPFVGEIRMFGGNFAPVGWAFCNGQLLPISENDTLFNLIGTTYGGDGQETFALPDLQGRIPVHMGSQGGNGYVLGQMAGQETVTLTTQQMPQHTHALLASLDIPTVPAPATNTTGQAAAKIYRGGSPTVQLDAAALDPAGGSQPHENMQPFQCVGFIISLYGIYPQQT